MPSEPLDIDGPYPGAVAAGLGRRLAAIALDWAAAIVVARLVLPGAAYGSSESALATLAIFFVEVALFTWLMASSFGQRIVGIAVVGIDGNRLGLWKSIVRTLLICLVIPALVYNSQGRGLQDIVAGSIVLMRRTLPGLDR